MDDGRKQVGIHLPLDPPHPVDDRAQAHVFFAKIGKLRFAVFKKHRQSSGGAAVKNGISRTHALVFSHHSTMIFRFPAEKRKNIRLFCEQTRAEKNLVSGNAAVSTPNYERRQNNSKAEKPLQNSFFKTKNRAKNRRGAN